MLVYMWQNHEDPAVEALILIGAAVGTVLGAVYGWRDKQSRVFCADAKVVAGLFSGILVSGLVWLPILFVGEIPYPWLVMIVAPSAILLYVTSASWFVKRCYNLVPAVVDGALVGVAVGGTTGMLFMIMAGAVDPELVRIDFQEAFVSRVHRVWAGAVAGSAGVCFVIGVLRAVLKVRWYNL
jgi:hypothetical protein